MGQSKAKEQMSKVPKIISVQYKMFIANYVMSH